MDALPDNIDWNQVRALLATVEAGSLSGAARRLKLTQPTLGRQVAALEQTLGVTLFERVGKSLVLTQAGRELVAPARAMGEAAHTIALVASRQSQAIDGLVRITASDVYAQYLLPPVLMRLREVAPAIVVEVVASNEVEDLIRRRADIAIRHVAPQEADLIARRLPDTTARLYATAGLIDRIGRPVSPERLASAAFIGFSDNNDVLIAELRRHGLAVSAANFPLVSNSGLVAWDWARRGLGLAMMMAPVAQATPEVEDAWPDFAGIAVPTWLATHRELRTSRRIRLVFDLLAEAFSGG